jgi:hypothetical protein
MPTRLGRCHRGGDPGGQRITRRHLATTHNPAGGLPVSPPAPRAGPPIVTTYPHSCHDPNRPPTT